jgi:DNA topoisomerase-1
MAATTSSTPRRPQALDDNANPSAPLAMPPGLRHADDTRPGYSRKREKDGFAYFDAAGKRIVDADEIERINALAIPPAYEDVWICADPRGHLQATGRDARGRKQYRYHPRWRETRDADNTSAWPSSAAHCRRFARVSPAISSCRACRATKWSRRSCNCWTPR